MRLAPAPTFAASMHRAPHGGAAVFHTLRLMREAINAGKADPDIINAAISVIYLMPEKDDYAEARALFHYVQRHIKYVRDVHGLETLAAPRLTLARMVGDCDDQSALLGAMLESVGIPTRLVMAAYSSNDFEHVYLQAFAGNEWHSCDPTEHYYFGWEAPGAHKMFIESV